MPEDGELPLRNATLTGGGRLTSTLSYIPHHGTPKGYPPLDSKPIALRTWFLVITTIFFLGCLGSISAILVCDHASQATLHLRAQRGFLAFRYLPSIIGTITTIWWQSIGAALFHVTPYISMAQAEASTSSGQRRRSVLSSYQSFLFAADEDTIRFLVNEKSWLMLSVICLEILLAFFLVPTKAAFVQLLPDEDGWMVSISRIAAGFLIMAYLLLITCTISIALWFYDRKTGLKWDPVCIADQIALIQGSNILESFHGLEFATKREAINALANSPAIPRLGYWRVGDTGEIWHGIAYRTDDPETLEPKTAIVSESKATRVSPAQRTFPFSDDQNVGTASRNTSQSNGRDWNDDSGVGPYSSSEGPLDWEGRLIRDPEHYRFRDIESLHSDTLITFYVLLGGLAISGLILTVSKGILHQGFYFPASRFFPLNPSSSPLTVRLVGPLLKNFIFAFCPSFVMTIFAIFWILTDNFYRAVQPIAGMYRAAPAHKSILLDYMQCPAIIAIPKAALNRHWRVTWFCLLALSASAGPIAAAGIFVSSPVEGGYIMRASPINLWFILSLLSVYLMTLPFARPRPKHRLPRRNLTIADLICYCYASKLVHDKMFCVQKRDDGKVHLESQVHLARKSYEFGLYQGTDGRRHMGIDIVDPQNPIDTIDPGRSIHVFGCRVWFRKPKVLKRNVA